MPRPRTKNPKVINKSLRVSKEEDKNIKRIVDKYNITEQKLFEDGYKLFIEKLESGVVDV